MTENTARGAIVVGVDGSSESNRALRWAVREAGDQGRALHLIHAVGLPTEPSFPARVRELTPRAVRAGRGVLHAAERAAHELGGAGLTITKRIDTGYPAEVLVESSAAARMLVLGATGYGGFPGMLAGSTTEAVATHADCPVAVIRTKQGVEDPPFEGPVVVGVDNWPPTDHALAVAFEQAASYGATLLAVHAWTIAAEGAYPIGLDTGIVEGESVTEEHRRMLRMRLTVWREKYPDVPVEQISVHAKARHELLHRSASARLLVIGSHGRGAFAGRVLGSVSRAMVYHARCPVLVVRQGSRP